MSDGSEKETGNETENVDMGASHQAGRYDWLADGVERVTGRPALSVRKFVSLYAGEFGGCRSQKRATPNNMLQPTGRPYGFPAYSSPAAELGR